MISSKGSALFTSLIGLVALQWLSGDAEAQVPHDITVGRTAAQDFEVNGSNEFVRFAADAGSSYACETPPLVATANSFLQNPVRVKPNNGFDPAITVTARLCGSDNPRTGVDPSRLCFTVPRNIPYPLVEVDVKWTGTYPVTVRVSCDETTLYANFNTSVTDFNFLELTNTLDTTTTHAFSPRNLTATVTALNTIPATDVVVIDNLSVSIPEGSRTDVDIHTAAGAGVFGPVKIAHNGAPGSLKAVVSQYNITSTNPLDFAPVAQDVAQTRGQIAGVNR